MSAPGFSALRDLIVQRYDDLKRRLTHRLGSADLAGEALHDTWLRLEQSQPDGTQAQAVKTPLAYVMRMASNAAVDRIRSEHRHLSGTELDLLVDELVDQSPGPARQAMGRAELEALSGVIDAMPARRREILIAVRVHEMPLQDVARHFGISPRVVSRELKAAHDFCAARMGR